MNVLVFGLGLHGGGVASARYYAQQGDSVCVTDLRERSQLAKQIEQLADLPIRYALGGHSSEDVRWADIIIKNPAVPPTHRLLIGTETCTTTDIRELLTGCATHSSIALIGVSGTKGKSSTVHTLKQLFMREGKKVLVSGNIGISGFETLQVLDGIKGDVTVVIELSSFQIRDLFLYGVPQGTTFSALFLTSLYADHQDYYRSVTEYVNEKLQLYTLNSTATYYSRQASDFLVKNGYRLPEHVTIYRSLSDLFETDLAGGLTGLPHRDQFIRTIGSTDWYDDSAATIPEATIHTLTSHKGRYILICGGSDKRSDYSVLSESLKSAQMICLLPGEATIRSIIPLLETSRIPYRGPFSSMKEAVRCAYQAAQECETCDVILSPSSASFSLFRNSDERGETFIDEVNAL
ncbi:MAG: hypothetical protein JXK93_01300 [Sphaerochaetaceae bacterium]|nr:hypothetical protein [Sphaerochaetaceae bacterium]